MASAIRASRYLRPLLFNRTSVIRISQQPVICKRHEGTTSLKTTITPDVVKWEVTEPIVKSKITGAIIPFWDQNLVQWLFFPYTYAVMYYLDFLTSQMPWWLAIVGLTATVRLCFFPLTVMQNNIGIRTYNILPQTQKLQQQSQEALVQGDNYGAAVAKGKLSVLFKEHNLSIKDRLFPILVQTPMFLSIFMLLRRLSYEPLPHLLDGGAFWFQNLTLPDPYYILPVVTCASVLLLLETGLEGTSNTSKAMGPVVRWMMRGLPLVMFAFVHNFPAAVLLFWTSNNLFTLSYALILKNSWVKKKLNVPVRMQHAPESLPMTQKTFKGQIKDAIDQSKVHRSTMEVRRLDDIAFRKAGVGPLRKTYKENPMQQKQQQQ